MGVYPPIFEIHSLQVVIFNRPTLSGTRKALNRVMLTT